MEASGGIADRFGRISQALSHVEVRLDPTYDMLKMGRLAFGDAPISLASTALTTGIRAVNPHPSEAASLAITHAGLAADGVARGLFYSGGLLHAATARKAAWLVNARPAPVGFTRLASGLSTASTYARLGLLGIGGVAGAARAARAVAGGGSLEALYATRDGRGGVIQAAGSALLMIKHPVAYLAGAGLFAAGIINEFTGP